MNDRPIARVSVTTQLELGAKYSGDGYCQFRVWAPLAERVELHLMGMNSSDIYLPMEPQKFGYYETVVRDALPGSLYLYRLDGKSELADPASQFQPQGVHSPSQVVDPDFAWGDQAWRGLPLQNYLVYELHVGTFTSAGTFDAIIEHLGELKELGITAVELMPVAQFPGPRNWGYDGVYPFAVQNSYGGPAGLKRFVDACHFRGLAVVLDVVYNHLGPEGNYLAQFGPYFTDRYRTPWGDALNFDGPYSDQVRHFFIQNALYWIADFHIDALRLDAVHAICDRTAQPFLQELADAAHLRADQLNRRICLIPESSLNDTRLVQPRAAGGYGLDAQWNDDFHHSLHTILTGENTGYYEDFGRLENLVQSYAEGYVYTGQYSSYRRRRHGHSSREVPAHRFVVYAQNHDQVGNRLLGERLTRLVSFASLKLAAGVVLLSPYIPLLFMGEEYGEIAPFLYFTSHSDPDLIEAVRKGRAQEFSSFGWQGEVPDPQAATTFESSRLNRDLRLQNSHRILREFHKDLIRLRNALPSLAFPSKEHLEVVGFEKQKSLFVRRGSGDDVAFIVFNFSDSQSSLDLPIPPGDWCKLIDSADHRWLGTGSSVLQRIHSEGRVELNANPKAFVLFNLAQKRPADHKLVSASS